MKDIETIPPKRSTLNPLRSGPSKGRPIRWPPAHKQKELCEFVIQRRGIVINSPVLELPKRPCRPIKHELGDSTIVLQKCDSDGSIQLDVRK